MAKTVTAMEARQNFGDLLNQVSLKQEEIVMNVPASRSRVS